MQVLRHWAVHLADLLLSGSCSKASSFVPSSRTQIVWDRAVLQCCSAAALLPIMAVV